MIKEQILILLVSFPLQIALLPFNRRYMVFTPGEIRFWSIAIFAAVELIFLAMW